MKDATFAGGTFAQKNGISLKSIFVHRTEEMFEKEMEHMKLEPAFTVAF